MNHELHGDGLFKQWKEQRQNAKTEGCIYRHFGRVHPGDWALGELEACDENTEGYDQRDAHVVHLKNSNNDQG